ncbi:MAG: phosphoribosylanthranilate isomerase [Campylobacter sp.]|nr:phosphoribosylanthranilate isomerase [Campylobacter sp.]
MEIKICGIKSVDEALSVVNLDIDYIGVIFAKSPRQIDPQTAQKIAKIAHDNNVKCVGVFANISDELIFKLCTDANLDVAQIYSVINDELYDKLNFADIEIWRVFSVSDTLPNLDGIYDLPLFDCKGKNLGGNGESFEWEILKPLKPYSFALAGGISLQNVLKAASYKPAILDINSKVEDENGQKNPEKIKQILEMLEI